MKRIKIYTCSSMKSPNAAKTLNKAVGYILVFETEKGPVELINTVLIEKYIERMTANQSELLAVIMAFFRINTKCEVDLYTDSQYVANGIARVREWAKNGWKNSKGKPIANLEDWKQLLWLMDGCVVHCHANERHEYSRWLPDEVNKNRQYVGKR